VGYGPAVRVGPLVVVAGTTAPGDGLAARTREVFRHIESAGRTGRHHGRGVGVSPDLLIEIDAYVAAD
jgi:hypothetical protein